MAVTKAKPAESRGETSRTSTASIRASFKAMSTTDRIVWGLLLAIVAVVPLAHSRFGFSADAPPLTNDQFDIVKLFVLRGFTLVAFAVWAWGLLVEGRRVRWHPVLLAVGAFLLWSTVSWAFALHPDTALFGKYRRYDGLITFVNYAVLMFLTLQYATGPSRIRVVAKTFFLSMTVVSLYGVMQSLGLDPIDWGRLPFEANRAFSTYGNPDILGGALVLAAPVSLALALSESDLRWRAGYWAGFLLNMWCVLVAFVRGAWIATFVALVVLAIALLVQRVRPKGMDWGFFGATGVAVAAAIGASLRHDSEVMNFAKRFATLLDTKSGSGLTRTQIWSAARGAIADSPWIGHGADSFRLLFPKYKPVEYVEAAGYLSVADNAHNYPLQLATGVGIVGAGLFYGTLLWVAALSARSVFRRDGSAGTLLAAGLWAACAGYVVHLMFGLSLTGVTFFLWTALALLVAPFSRVVDVTAPRWGRMAAVAVLVLMLAGSIGNVRYVMADQAYLQSQVTQLSNPDQALEFAYKAIRLNPHNDIYRAAPGIMLADRASARLTSDTGSLEAAGDELLRAEAVFKDVIAYCPAEYDNYVFLSNVYNMLVGLYPGQGYEERAVEIARDAVELEPYGPAARAQLAQALWVVGDKDEAIEHLEYAIEMDPNFAYGVGMLERFESADEETETP